MEGRATLKLVPSEKVLLENAKINCTMPNCESSFDRLSNFEMHLVKHHNIRTKNIDMDTDIQYFCPVLDCKYNVENNDGKHFFRIKKYIRQHYMKVHAAKNTKCSKCDKTFVNESLMKQHERICGKIFQCIDCEWKYSSRECLLTHCRRKGHRTPPLQSNKRPQPSLPSLPPQPKLLQSRSKGPVRIAPKKPTESSSASDFTMKEAQSSANSAEATVWRIRENFKRIMNKAEKPMETNMSPPVQATQTTETSNATVETEIVVATGKIGFTQTTEIGVQHTPNLFHNQILPHLSSNNAPDDEYKTLDFLGDETSHFLNDTVYARKTPNNLLSWEDDSSLQYFTVNNFNVGLCDIETQTEFTPLSGNGSDMTSNDLDPLLCNMHTQTTDELLNDFGFGSFKLPTDPNDYLSVSTQTQTCADAMEMIPAINNISTETQTMNADFKLPSCSDLMWPKSSNQFTQT